VCATLNRKINVLDIRTARSLSVSFCFAVELMVKMLNRGVGRTL
jgi:hypothetical protein